MSTEPDDPTTSAVQRIFSGPHPCEWAALYVAVIGAAWFLLDTVLARLALDRARSALGEGEPWNRYSQRHGDIVEPYQLRSTLVIALLFGLAGVLHIALAGQRDPRAVVGIGRWIGLSVAVWCVGMLVVGFALIGDDFAVNAVVIGTAIGIATVAIVWLISRTRTARSDRPALVMPWSPPQVGVAVAAAGTLLAAFVVAVADRSEICGPAAERGQVVVSLCLALGTCVLGLVLLVLRRWFIGLVAIMAGGGFALILAVSLACLN